MPNKKKKYSARFPPARIKKIMQKDDEVGKVAAAVPVIISRSLELFIESLIKKTNDLVVSKNAKTLTPQHIKQTVLQDREFNFLNELVSTIPDVQLNEDEPQLQETTITPPVVYTPTQPTPIITTTTATTTTAKVPSGKPRGRPKKIKNPDEPFFKPKKSKKMKMDDGSSGAVNSEDSSNDSDNEKSKLENKFVAIAPSVFSPITTTATSHTPTTNLPEGYTLSYPSYKYIPRLPATTSTILTAESIQPQPSVTQPTTLPPSSLTFVPTSMKISDALLALNNYDGTQQPDICMKNDITTDLASKSLFNVESISGNDNINAASLLLRAPEQSVMMMTSVNDEALDLSTSSMTISPSKMKDDQNVAQTTFKLDAMKNNFFSVSSLLKHPDATQLKSASVPMQPDACSAEVSEKPYITNSYLLNIPKVTPQHNLFLQQNTSNVTNNTLFKIYTSHIPISIPQQHGSFTNSLMSPPVSSIISNRSSPFFPTSSSNSTKSGNDDDCMKIKK